MSIPDAVGPLRTRKVTQRYGGHQLYADCIRCGRCIDRTVIGNHAAVFQPHRWHHWDRPASAGTICRWATARSNSTHHGIGWCAQAVAASSRFPCHANRIAQCAVDGARWPACRLRYGLGQRVQQRPWSLRAVAIVYPLALRHADIYGDRCCDGVRRSTCDGTLNMGIVIHLVAGVLFGFGLLHSGMADG